MLVVVLVSACWTGSQPATEPQLAPEPPAPSSAFRPRHTTNACSRTIAEMADKLRPELAKAGLGEATVTELIDAVVESCRETEWSAELLACYDGAIDATDLDKCQNLMTSEQSQDVSRRMMDVISRSTQLPPPPPPPPGP